MSMYSMYRVCIWLPIAVPVIVFLLFDTAGLRLSDVLLAEVLVYSVLYGGLPYAVLAAWATWWVGGRSEADIRWLMFRAPLVMIAGFVPLALFVGIAAGNLGSYVAVAIVGSLIILALGYAYVGLVVLLRHGLGSPAAP